MECTMPKAKIIDITARRNARRDAELIRLCDRLRQIDAQIQDLCDAFGDEDVPDSLFAPLDDEHHKIRDCLFMLERPYTAAGARAVALAVMCAPCPRDMAEAVAEVDLDAWLFAALAAFCVANPLLLSADEECAALVRSTARRMRTDVRQSSKGPDGLSSGAAPRIE